jgi:peptide-methionine (S)-S-oxide reductase
VSIFSRRPSTLPSADEALPGRDVRPFAVGDRHVVLDAPVITDEVPEGYEVALFGLGCFWGAEEIYWQVPGCLVDLRRVRRGITPNPTYEEVCTGRTGHTEAVGSSTTPPGSPTPTW